MSAPQGEGQATEGTAGAEPAPTDPGFPANTPLEQMTVEQREAYWKDKARKHEDRVKAFGRVTPEEVAGLRAKAEKQDALEYELASDKDKAVADATLNARLEAYAELAPKLVQAEFRAAAAGRIEPDKLATLLEPLDLAKFLGDDGEPDTARVQAYIESIAPDTGNQQQRPGPSSSGQGHRAPVVAKPGEAGRLAAMRRGFISAS